MHTFEPLKQQDENQFSWWVKVNQTQEWVGVAKTLSEFQTNIESANTESNYTCVSIHDSKDVYDGTQKKYIMRQRISVASPGVNIQFAMTHSIWINYESIDSFIDKMNQESIEFLVIIGNDFIPKNAIENKNLMTHLNRLKMPYFVSNAHPKIQGRNKTYWKNILGDNNFAFDHKTVRFVFIDSSEHSLQQFQYNLLETWSQRTPLIWSFQPQIRSRFLFTRNAFLSHGDQIGDDLVFDHQMEGVRILNLLNRYDFEAIFSSNESFLKLEEKNSIRHILVPPLFDPKQADPLQWIKVQIQIDCNRPSITECMKTDLHRGVLDHSQ